MKVVEIWVSIEYTLKDIYLLLDIDRYDCLDITCWNGFAYFRAVCFDLAP